MSYDDRERDPTTLHEQNIVERGEAAVRAAVMRDLESGERRFRPIVAEVDDLVSRLSKLESNDIGNAERLSTRLSTRFGHNLIFVANRGWFSWTETHWSNKEGRNFVRAAAIKSARLIAGEAQCIEEQGQYSNERETDFDRRIAVRRQHANNSGNLSKIRGLVELAEIDLNIEPEELDRRVQSGVGLNGIHLRSTRCYRGPVASDLRTVSAQDYPCPWSSEKRYPEVSKAACHCVVLPGACSVLPRPSAAKFNVMAALIVIEPSSRIKLPGIVPAAPSFVSWLATDLCAEQYPESFS